MNAVLLALLVASPVPPAQGGKDWQPVLMPAVVVEAEAGNEAPDAKDSGSTPSEASPEPRPTPPPANLGHAQVKQAR